MTPKRMDNVGLVVEDIDAAIAFFTELGPELEGRARARVTATRSRCCGGQLGAASRPCRSSPSRPSALPSTDTGSRRPSRLRTTGGLRMDDAARSKSLASALQVLGLLFLFGVA